MLLYGAGGHAKVIISIAQRLGIEIKGIFDDAPKVSSLKDIPVYPNYDPHFLPQEPVIISIGNNQIRRDIKAKVRHPFAHLTHPSALVEEVLVLGEGSVVFPQAIIQIDARLGAQVIVNTAALIEHDCLIEDYVHVGPRSTLCGGVKVGEGSLIGAASTVLPNIQIGRWTKVGAGAVVTKDIPDFAMVIGNPARIISNSSL
ncbi:MAG: acetyltransferase [Bacteroidota bacterium]